MSPDPAEIGRLAARYGWDMTGDEAAARPERILLRTLDMGRWDDVLVVEARLGTAGVRRLIETAPAGGLSPRSWTFWRYRLGLVARRGRPCPTLPDAAWRDAGPAPPATAPTARRSHPPVSTPSRHC